MLDEERMNNECEQDNKGKARKVLPLRKKDEKLRW